MLRVLAVKLGNRLKKVAAKMISGKCSEVRFKKRSASISTHVSSLMCPAELLVPHPEPAAQLMRTFMPPAATGAAARTHGIPNFQAGTGYSEEGQRSWYLNWLVDLQLTVSLLQPK
ncbi:hypothetical protein SEVIR_4G160526v4 [Setaria viridis]